MPTFDIVTTVPSRGPLARLARDFCWPTMLRYRSLLAGSGRAFAPHGYDRARFVASAFVDAPVLLIEDTWATGAATQSAAAALRAAGAPAVAAVTLGHHVNVEYRDTGLRLAADWPLFQWSRCEPTDLAAVTRTPAASRRGLG